MSPFTRNLALTAAATVLPALIGLAVAPERTRSLPHRIGHRVRDLFEDDDSVEGSLRRITARLDDLSHQIELRGASTVERMRDTSPTMRLAAALAALFVIPAALTAIFAPERLRSAGSRLSERTRWDDVEDDPAEWGDDVGELEERLEKQRSDAVSAVSRAANRED